MMAVVSVGCSIWHWRDLTEKSAAFTKSDTLPALTSSTLILWATVQERSKSTLSIFFASVTFSRNVLSTL